MYFSSLPEKTQKTHRNTRFFLLSQVFFLVCCVLTSTLFVICFFWRAKLTLEILLQQLVGDLLTIGR
jgi:hypothetical protein